MEKYDLNLQNGVQVVETTIQSGNYKGKIFSVFKGNCFGSDILDFDFYCQDADIKNDCSLRYNDEYFWSAELHDNDGNTLHIDGTTDDFNNMIVKNEIIGQYKSLGEVETFIRGVLWES